MDGPAEIQSDLSTTQSLFGCERMSYELSSRSTNGCRLNGNKQLQSIGGSQGKVDGEYHL